MLRLHWLPFIALSVTGCGLHATAHVRDLFEEQAQRMHIAAAAADTSEAACQGLETLYLRWGATAAGSSFLAGSGGVSTLATKGGSQSAIGVTSLLVGVLGAVSVFVSNHYTERYSDCLKSKLQELARASTGLLPPAAGSGRPLPSSGPGPRRTTGLFVQP